MSGSRRERGTEEASAGTDSVIRIKPYHFIHVLDTNTNVTSVTVGPCTFVRQDHLKVVYGPRPMVTIPPRHYVVISNPVLRDRNNQPMVDEYRQYKLAHGDMEIRFSQDPFPLYPGEQQVGEITPLTVVGPNQALRLRALRDFNETVSGASSSAASSVIRHVAGDEWLFEGPNTYEPRVEVQIVQTVEAIIVKPNQGLRLRAKRSFRDRKGQVRRAGEEWIHREEGSYLPGIEEEVVGVINARVLTEKKALHLRALRTFTDVFNKLRKAGEEWLVTIVDAETHIPDVHEEVVGEVNIVTLSTREYCIILDPVGEDGKPQFGQRQLRQGEASFFLKPGEKLEGGKIQPIHVLAEEEALLLRAKETYAEGEALHKPGDRWMIYGPRDYIPPVQVEIVEKRRKIPLDENEGIYVRDIRSGKVRKVCGQSYMLQPNEELWAKELNKAVEDLLVNEIDPLADRTAESRTGASGSARAATRDKTRVITFRVPHNAAVQIYDYKRKQARVVFGPDLVMLDPEEQFTMLNLSGGKPKKPNTIKSLALLLGPDFMTDIIVVETSDHARLQLQLSYNWHFEVDRTSEIDASKIFQVPDFVGDTCKAIASRVRGAVASCPFDAFHKNSTMIIRRAVFGVDAQDHVRERLVFDANNLIVTNVDIQSVEPIDQRTRDSLQKSVQLAIEITTKSQEATARHEAERREQEAKGRLERQRIADQAEAEKSRRQLLELQAESATIESTGRAKSEAEAKAKAASIEGEASVEQARLRAQALQIESDASLRQTIARQKAEIDHKTKLNQLEIAKLSDLSEIEAKKFKQLVDSIGPETIAKIARSGPEMQVKMLQSLNLSGYLITDGKSPVNLFSTASGLVGTLATQAAAASSSSSSS